jgi:Domain of unknown function (DUF4157)/Putative RNase-like toxin, toxin_1
MSDSHTTATPEVTNATPMAHPPVRENQRAVEAEQEQGASAGQWVMRAVGGGSPETPPEQFSGVLGQMSGRSQSGMLRQLQRSYGNSYVGSVIQRKADGNGACTDCEKKEKEIQRKGEGDVSAVPDGFEATMQRSGAGHPLDEGTRSFMESRFGQDFGDVKIHTDSAAAEASQQIQAQAFTTGRDIYFGRGRFQPQATEGKKLIAHELTHVVQQAGCIQTKLTVGQSGDAYEQEAEQVAEKVIDAASPVATTTKYKPEGMQVKIQTKPLIQRDGEKGEIQNLFPDVKAKQLDFQPYNDTWVRFTDNPKYVNLQIQSFIADVEKSKTGLNDLDTFINAIPGQFKVIDPVAGKILPSEPSTDEDTKYKDIVCKVVKQEANNIKRLAKSYEVNFEILASNKVISDILNESKTRIEEEQSRLGIKIKKTDLLIYTTESYEISKDQDKNIRDAANELLDKLKDIATASADVQHIKKAEEDERQSSDYGDNLPPGGLPNKSSRNFTQELEEANVNLDRFENQYDQIRAKQETSNPILATYQLDRKKPETTGILHKLSFSSEERAETLGTTIIEKLRNIEQVRKDVSDRPSRIWQLPAIVAATDLSNQSGYSSFPELIEPLKNTIVSEKKATEEVEKVFLDVALPILAVGAALLATPAAGAAVAAIAGATDAGLTIAMGLRSLDEYQFETAAQGTDFDKAKAISQGEEPSLFWLAMDLLPIFGMAAKGVKGALRTARGAFKSLVALRREAIAAKVAVELTETLATEAGSLTPKARYQKALAELETTGNQVKEGSNLGTKLRDEVSKTDLAKGTEGPRVTKATPEGHLIVAGPDGIQRCSPPPCPLLRVIFAPELALKENKNLLQDLAEADKFRSAGKLEEAALLAAQVEKKLLGFRAQKLLGDTLYTKLAKLELEPHAIDRIIEKVTNGLKNETEVFKIKGQVKGQIFEELLAIDIQKQLKNEAGRKALFSGKEASASLKSLEKQGLKPEMLENAQFYPGHLIKDGKGRQLTDGIIAVLDGDKLYIVQVFEAKAGSWAAKGLGITEKEILTAINLDEIKKITKETFQRYKLKSEKLGQPFLHTYEQMENEFIAAYSKKKEIGGQIRKDIERLDFMMNPVEDSLSELPTTIKLNGNDVSVVGFSATKTKFTGVLPRNISPVIIHDTMAKQGGGFANPIKEGGEVINFGTMSINIESKDLYILSDEIATAVDASVKAAANK